MASNSAGIQQLLSAEKRAAERVAEARKKKAKRLKQAKEEAQQEIEAYRQQRDKGFKEHEAKILGSRGDMESRTEVNTNLKIKELEVGVNENKEKALARLLNLVHDIKPELHENLRLDS